MLSPSGGHLLIPLVVALILQEFFNSIVLFIVSWDCALCCWGPIRELLSYNLRHTPMLLKGLVSLFVG